MVDSFYPLDDKIPSPLLSTKYLNSYHSIPTNEEEMNKINEQINNKENINDGENYNYNLYELNDTRKHFDQFLLQILNNINNITENKIVDPSTILEYYYKIFNINKDNNLVPVIARKKKGPSSLFKNIGLGYLNLIKNFNLYTKDKLVINDVFHIKNRINWPTDQQE